ncbi:MAG: hypothetical protein KGI37_03820 [Alphaproteobacteria bacterium]|nr:hypothetical protein [Alphaproteobacteria bacterium]
MSGLSQKTRRLIDWVRSVLFYGHWMIGVVDQPIENAVHWTRLPPVRWIAPFDRKRYMADPFPWPGSTDTILCEICDAKSHVGHLAALKIGDGGLIDEMRIDLPARSHLSFPFLFRLDGVVFMMPESSASRKLEIFQWRENDGQWVPFVSLFLDKPAADATLFEKDGLLWISYTDVSDHPHDNLNLIYARTLAGPWVPHPKNPVRRGTQSSRNAGAVFTADGKLYRPSQDCSRLYGGSIRIMEITTCTPDDYAEREVNHIRPSAKAYTDGVHTLMPWGENKCLVDGMRLTFSPRLLAKKILRRMGLLRQSRM